MDTGMAVLMFLLYLALFALYIYLIILFVRMSNDVRKLQEIVKDISFRDTARYISEVQSGKITESAQTEAEESFK